MSESIFAIIGLIVGGAVGVLVIGMLTVSKRADEDAERLFSLYVKRKYKVDCDPKIKMSRCPYCGAIEGGATRVW